jgi:toxin YoeB
MYRLVFTDDAKKGLVMLQKKAPTAIKKLNVLLNEIREHPTTGTGQIEQLKHYREETWSRRINHEHRIAYRVYEDVVEVLILSVYGHYDDK